MHVSGPGLYDKRPAIPGQAGGTAHVPFCYLHVLLCYVYAYACMCIYICINILLSPIVLLVEIRSVIRSIFGSGVVLTVN